MKSVKLFLALGLMTTVGLSGNTVDAGESSSAIAKHDRANTAIMAQGGEGGEGGEGDTQLSPGEQANADFQDKMSGAELLSELQNGGYVIYFRHTQTEKDYADQVTANVNDCSTQRVLSEEGVQQALAIGDAFAASEIPLGKVTTSEYCRAWNSAALAFGNYEKDPALNFLPFEDYTDEQMEKMKANVTPLLTAVPEDGTNNIIVGHDDIFEAATGIYPDPQGMAYVVKPDGNGGFEVMANLLPEEWAEL
ncbi:MAG: histidine phosphatase family protein [Pleurocapsa sp. CRU_1_2]|nr:histidine phosphatase family protein [Pleurocapsa sp. CRU_1_2]